MLLCFSTFHCHGHPAATVTVNGQTFSPSRERGIQNRFKSALTQERYSRRCFLKLDLRVSYQLVFPSPASSRPPCCSLPSVLAAPRWYQRGWRPFHLQLPWFSPLLCFKDLMYKGVWSVWWPTLLSPGPSCPVSHPCALLGLCHLCGSSSSLSQMGSFFRSAYSLNHQEFTVEQILGELCLCISFLFVLGNNFF